MTLSDDERNSLNRIENSLAEQDPDFANRLDVVAVQPRTWPDGPVSGFDTPS
jgi:hypothetical protein